MENAMRVWPPLGAVLLLFSVVLTLVPANGPVKAMPLSPEVSLETFSVIVFEDMNANSSVEGRTYVGGDLSGGSTTYFSQGNTLPVSNLDALYVGGNVTGGFKQVNSSGDAQIAGNVQNMNMNGGTAFIGGTITGTVNGSSVTGATVTLPDVQSGLVGLSSDLTALVANSGVVLNGNLATFEASPDANGVAVFDILDGDTFFSSIMEITFELNGATDVFINVGGTSILFEENFVAAGMNGVLPEADRTIWNFYEATNIDITRQFFGAVLAPNATVTNSQEISGNVVARNFNQGGQVRLPTFSGNLPHNTPVSEPHHALVLLAGLGALVAGRHRKRRRHI